MQSTGHKRDDETNAVDGELLAIGAIGWFLGVWVLVGLRLFPAVGAGALAVAVLWATFGSGETMRERGYIHGLGGGWFLLLSAAPLVALDWLVTWIFPATPKDRLAVVLGAIALGVSAVLLLRSRSHRARPLSSENANRI